MMGDWIRRILIAVLLAGAILLMFAACGYNLDRRDLCEAHDMRMVQDYFGRGYGCGTFVEFEELE